MTHRARERDSDWPQPLWEQGAPQPEDAQAAALVRQAEPLEPLPEIDLRRIHLLLLQKEKTARERAAIPFWLKGVVVAAVSFFVVAATAAAAIGSWPALRDRVLHAIAAHLDGRAQSGTTIRLPPAAPADDSSTKPSIAAPSAQSMVVDPLPIPSPAAKQSNAADRIPERRGSATQSTSRDDETRLYSRALSQLNIEHDPQGALATLGVYRLMHPKGIFQGESSVALVKAQLMLGRDAEALALLDAMYEHGFTGIPQAKEIALLRAELLVHAARCAEAFEVLKQYEGRELPGEQRERVLVARASCRARLEDLDGARKDLRDYLDEFPNGRFVSLVRETLRNLPEP
jgi:hypothetical protein